MSQQQTDTLKRETSLLQYSIEICHNNETNMKNDDIRALAFGQYIIFICYKQPVSIYLGKRNNVGKTAEDRRGGLKQNAS